MDANEKVINTFATRVRQMILQYEESLRKENQRLTSLSEERLCPYQRTGGEKRAHPARLRHVEDDQDDAGYRRRY